MVRDRFAQFMFGLFPLSQSSRPLQIQNFQICENVCPSGSTDSPASVPLQIQLKRKGIRPLLSDSMDLRILSFLSEWGVVARPISTEEASEFYSKSFEFSGVEKFHSNHQLHQALTAIVGIVTLLPLAFLFKFTKSSLFPNCT